MTDWPALSVDDLACMFEPHHRELAARLRALAVQVTEVTEHAALAARLGAELDLYSLVLPPTGAIDVRGVCLARELLAYVSPLADSIFAVQGLGTYPILVAGSDRQRALVPRFRAGELICAFALTEPEAGSDVASLQTVACRDGEHYVLEGRKTLISNVGIATHYLVFASVDRAAGHKGITAFLVDAHTAGLRSEPIELNVDHPIGSLVFRDCRVPDHAVVGELGGGFSLAMTTLDTFRVTVGAAAVGMARRAFDAARVHTASRRQFGKPLRDQQIVQAYLADMATELDAARLLVARAAGDRDAGGRATKASGHGEALCYGGRSAHY